jgi:peroxiredoxin
MEFSVLRERLTTLARHDSFCVVRHGATMRQTGGFSARFLPMGLFFFLALIFFASGPVQACTIFVLTDTNRALFCNNEDWTNSKTRIWFQPAGDSHYGVVYVGFDDGWAQGGLNTEGLAYDWVAGYSEKWEPDPRLPEVRGNSSQRMLETCATVADAVAFYRSHREAGFWRGKILVADKTGASVIIGAEDGKLRVEEENQCRGFGARWLELDMALAMKPQPVVTNGFIILRDCRQKGLTKYSNIYDLLSGDVFLYPLPEHDDMVKFNLAAELRKGAHYYDMPQIHEQLTQPLRPLLANMKGLPLDRFKPIPDQEPKVTAHVRAMVQDMFNGTMQADDYSAESWKQLLAAQKQIQSDLKRLGDFVSLTLVDRGEVDGRPGYRYRLEFANATVLQHLVLDGQNKVATSDSEDVAWKAGAKSFEAPDTAIVGTGLALGMEGQHVVVKGIVPDSPAAAQKDIRVGDRITAIAQGTGPAVPLQSEEIAQVAESIRGSKGTAVRLTIVPAGEDESHARVVSLVREELLKGLPRLGESVFLTNGMKAPDIEMIGLTNGKTEHLSDYAGKIVVLQFWAADCYFCQQAMADFQNYSTEHPEWKGRLVLITASTGHDQDAAAQQVKVNGWDQTHNVSVGDSAIKAFQVKGIPSTYVIDERGKIVAGGYLGGVWPVTP